MRTGRPSLHISPARHCNITPVVEQDPFVTFGFRAILYVGVWFIAANARRAPPEIPPEASFPISTEARGCLSTLLPQKRKRQVEDVGSREHEDALSTGSKQLDRSMVKRGRASSGDLSCPFATRTPERHNECRGIQLNNIGAVARHLRALHRQPPYCPTCWATFTSDAERDGHIRRLKCVLAKQTPIEGLTLRQARRLGRFVDNTDSSMRTWNQLFRIAFPNDKPSRVPRGRQGIR